ncbi:MAG: hypothetical protein HC778_05400, partial [Chamaesiphon sp. CSU_1_12]|nr:hypothetical protein [Chamaesiphon sp. CSU_1_12]
LNLVLDVEYNNPNNYADLVKEEIEQTEQDNHQHHPHEHKTHDAYESHQHEREHKHAHENMMHIVTNIMPTSIIITIPVI